MSKPHEIKQWFPVAIGFTAALLLICGWYLTRAVFYNDELNSKVEWSVIQAVASQHSGDIGNKVELVKLDRYAVVGVPVEDARKTVWIMLNPRNSPYYKQGPSGDYKISGEDLKRILASGVVSSTVANCLGSHVE